MKTPAAFVLVVCLCAPAAAQSVTDGIMVARDSLFTGGLYTYDTWDRYWEGALQRVNGNIGTITTQTNTWYADYGLTNRLNVIGGVPYVWTSASQGVLHGISGLQDLTLAAKYRLLEARSTPVGTVKLIGVASAGIPLTNYNPELLPLSIGIKSARVAGRGTLNVQADRGWYANGSMAYTWRGDVTLDRPYYFTDGEFVMSDKADMPNALDYIASGGYMKRGLMLEGFVTQQFTLGGGDIRRQDMPFVSNRMNVSRAGGLLMYPIPGLHSMQFHFTYAYTFDGRNVGQATTITTGLLYTFNGRPTQ